MPIRIGVIGTGIMGTDHVATITTAVSGAEVCCIADIDARRAEVIASRVPGAKALSSAESLIESPDVDSVIIFVELFVTAGYGYEIKCEIVGKKGTIELAPTSQVVVRSDLKVSQNFPPDWRGRFAEAYRRELQTWVDAISRWRSGTMESDVGPVDGPDAWDGYRAAVVSQAVLASMSQGDPVPVESMSLPEFYRRCRAPSR